MLFCGDMDERDQYFIEYWEANRERESKLLVQLLRGIPIGLIFALPVLLIVFTSRFWYKRADMLVNAKLNPWVLIIAIFFIAVFVAVFYKRHQWDMKDQHYNEIKKRKKPEVGGDAAKQL